MNKIIRQFVLASALLVAIGVAPPPLISWISTAHAQTNTAPTIALAADTGSSPSDGITNNGVVNVTGLADGATWKYVTDGGSTFTAGSGSSFTLPEGVYDANDVQVVQTVSGTDSAPALLGAVTVDTTGPELVRHNDKFADGEINTEQTHTFIFSEPVTGLEVGDFTGASVTVNRVIDSGDHITYTLYFTPSPRAAVIGGNLLLSRNAVTDLAGNMGPSDRADVSALNTGSGSNTVVAADTTAPTVDFGTIDVGVIGTRQTHTIRFNQIVTGFAASDITATGATVNSLSGSGSTYTITFTPTLTSFTLTLAADSVSDTAATPNTGPATEPAAARSVTGSAVLSADADLATLSITDNNGNPVTPNEAIAPDTLTYTATAPSDTTSVTITVTAADSNAEVDLDSLGTNTENFGFRDAMQSFAIEITAADGTRKLYRITITRAVSVDTTAPSATFGAVTIGAVGTQQTVGLTFDEAVTGLEAGDFSGSTDVTVDSVTGSGDTWSITFTPSETSFTLTLAADSVEDLAATPNTGPETAASVTGTAVDTTAPSATFGTIIAGAVGTQQTVSLTFDEAVTGLEAGDFSGSTGVTVDSVTGSGDTWSITYTPTAAAFTLTLAANSVSDLAAIPNTGPAEPVSASPDSAAAEVILSEIARAIADQNISAIVGRVERARTQPNGTGFNFAGQQMLFGGNANANANGGGNSMSSTLANLMNSHGQALEDDTLDMKSLLGNSEFTMPLNAIGGGAGTGSGTTFWGSGDYRNLSGEDKDLDWDGDLFSLHLGVDAHITAESIGGVALSWSEGEMDYDDGSTTGTGKKTYDTRMVSINPYFSWGNEYGEVWMTAGYGEGELEGDDGTTPTKTNDLSMQTFAIGGNSILLQRGADTLRLKGEVSQSTLEVDKGKPGSLDEMELDASRIRLSLESTNSITRDNGARIDRKVELGIRHDGGDGVTGSGIELGLGLRHVSAAGLSVEGKIRGLLGHNGDINEWGISGTIKQSAGADGQGFSFALSPGYGDDASDIQRLWEHGLDADGNATTNDDATNRARDYTARLDARVGYGMNGFSAPNWLGFGSGLLTPYSAMTLSDDSNRYRLGVQWKLGDRFDLDLVGERQDADSDTDAILLKGELRF